MERQIAFENPWYGMINSPEQEARRKARMKQDAKAYQKQRAKRMATDTCMVLAAVLLAVIGICHQLGV